MSCDWQVITLDEIVMHQKGFAFKSRDYKDSGVPVVRVSNFTMDSIDCTDLKYVDQSIADKNASVQLVENDVVIATVGSWPTNPASVVGKTVCVPKNVNGSLLNQNAVRLRVKNNDEFDQSFLYYLLKNKNFSDYIVATAQGSANQASITLKDIYGYEFAYPEQQHRKKIASYLTSIDNKIELNTQTNQTLEEMAQAIFKSWFVDFDPVKAKMNGEQAEGMDATTASLFPEKLDSETGIPVGWSQGIIADIAKLNAKSWTKKNQPEQVHYVDLANTKNGVIETVTTYDFDEAPSRARRVLNSGDTIVGTVRPGNRSFAFIGETEQPLTGSTGFAVLSPKEEFWTSFVYLATTNDDAIDEYARLADGGAYPAIKPVVVADTPCVIPTTDIAQKFWQLTGAMLKKAHQNRLENEELAKLRDTLLPKLLSGEIELGEVKEQAEVN